MTLEELLDLLEGVKPAGNGYAAICPAHDDRNASLSVTEGDERLLLHCHAGCDPDDILSKLGKDWRDIVYNAGPDYSQPEAVYDYTNESGEVLFQAVRFPGKQFRQRHYAPEDVAARADGYVWNLDGVRRVLYRLPEVIAAVAEARTVYVVEGEKDVESLREHGKTATCNPMGAGKWREEYTEQLRGAKVIILIDKDDPGRSHAEQVRSALAGIAANVFVYQSKVGKDISDHLAAGLDFTDLQPVKPRVRRGVLTAVELGERMLENLTLTQDQSPGFVLPVVPLIFRPGRMYAVGGYTGDGKSTLGVQATRLWCERETHVTYFTLEMSELDLSNVLLAHKGIPLRVLEEPWQIPGSQWAKLYTEGVEEIQSWNLDIIFESSGMTADRITEIVRDRESDIVVVDHIHRLAWGGERRKFEEELNKLTNIALELNVVLVLLCQLREPRMYGKDIVQYPRPNLQSFRESGVIGQDASMALSIWRQRDSDGLRYTGYTEVILLKNRHVTTDQDEAGKSWFVNYDKTTRTITSGNPPQEDV